MKLNKKEKNYLLSTLFKGYVIQCAICSVLIFGGTFLLGIMAEEILRKYVLYYYLYYRTVYLYGVRLPPLCQKPHINLLGRVTDQVFSESEEWDIDTVSETIASEYERATNLSINKEKQNLPIEEKRTIDVKEIREWLNFIITIISVVLGVTNSSATTINNYNYTQQVNNYYIVGMGYDAKELNTTKYRIVNRESIVRLKHDCHSIVIEKLEEGKVVRIIDKYKKWRQIIWENEDGEECMGWIQNYKLTEFKVPRNK